MDALPVGWMLVAFALIGLFVFWIFTQVISGVLQRIGEILVDRFFGGHRDKDK